MTNTSACVALLCFAALAAVITALPASESADGEAPASILTIPLDKQYVPVVRNNKTVSYKTSYFGKIFVGLPKPQAFTVVFDTGSAHLFIPSTSCEAKPCVRHRSFDCAASGTCTSIDYDGKPVKDGDERDQVTIAYGTGEVTGDIVQETVCLVDNTNRSVKDAKGCVGLRMVAATELSEEPFDSFNFDGVLGLALDSLALDPRFSFFGQLSKSRNREATFGYFLSRTDSVASEISFGGHDERRVDSALEWVPVHKPELGFWQVQVRSVSVAGQLLPICEEGDCVAIADTGTSLLGVPRQVAQRVHVLLARKVPGDHSAEEELDCREFGGPDLVFELADGVKLTLGPEDYSRTAPMVVQQNSTSRSQTICRASLLPVGADNVLGPKSWILGEPALRKYYTAYDWKRQRIGFAVAKQPEEGDEEVLREGSQGHSVTHPSPTAPLAPTVVHV